MRNGIHRIQDSGDMETFFPGKAGQSAKCKICSTILKATGGSTKGLHEHLKRIHGTNAMNRKNPDDSQSQPSASTSTSSMGPMKKYLLTTLDDHFKHVSSWSLCEPGVSSVIPGNDISNSRFPGICVPMTGMDSLLARDYELTVNPFVFSVLYQI